MRMTFFRFLLMVLLVCLIYNKRYRILQLLIGIAGLKQLFWSQAYNMRHFLSKGMDWFGYRDFEENES
ncbi:hypothetical protein EV207_10321 [Scopulibacillus darangshiensis]|uniref:Uncharacterized protein n=1 Tax=Scopulibacillus darangshiensis TaxID=442528 RepID=A0A4R2P841_9BACL|nr:hypothetical protein [Scopulibacillus darangshiensis]TCP31140.1 hypothetical protein EV207_10321 [Scopulibacillus darangshiensis]